MMNINQYKFKSRHLVSWFQSSDTKCVFFEKLVSFLMKKHEIFEIPKTNLKVMTIEVIQSHLDHLKGSCLSLLKFVCFRSQVPFFSPLLRNLCIIREVQKRNSLHFFLTQPTEK